MLIAWVPGASRTSRTSAQGLSTAAHLPRTFAAFLASGLLLAACTPSPEDVIGEDAYQPTDGIWCEAFTDDDITALVGEDQLDRVRAVGTLPIDEAIEDHRTAHERRSEDCTIVWADGSRDATVAEVTLGRLSWAIPDQSFDLLYQLTGYRGVYEEDSVPTQPVDGVFLWHPSSSRTSTSILTFGRDDQDEPIMEYGNIRISTRLAAELTDDQRTEIGRRLQDALIASPRTPEDARPFTETDLETFMQPEDDG